MMPFFCLVCHLTATLFSQIFPAPQTWAIVSPLWLAMLSLPTCPHTCSSIKIHSMPSPLQHLSWLFNQWSSLMLFELQKHFLPLIETIPFCLVLLNYAYTSSPELAYKLPEDIWLWHLTHRITSAKHPAQNGFPGLGEASFTQLFTTEALSVRRNSL